MITSYIKNGINIAPTLHEFLCNEDSFRKYILAYKPKNRDIVLRIKENNIRISSALFLDCIYEVKRITEKNFIKKRYDSIVEWHESVSGNISLISMAESVFIGNDIPLWQILLEKKLNDSNKLLYTNTNYDNIIISVYIVVMILLIIFFIFMHDV